MSGIIRDIYPGKKIGKGQGAAEIDPTDVAAGIGAEMASHGGRKRFSYTANIKDCIGSTIRKCRIESGRSQLECSRDIGVSSKTWGIWESGKGFPTADKIPAICKAIGISAGVLFGEMEGFPVRLELGGYIERSHIDENGMSVIDEFVITSAHFIGKAAVLALEHLKKNVTGGETGGAGAQGG